METRQFETVEINGVKFEVDLSTARKVEEFRVGDKVKVLMKRYSDSYEIKPGVIIGFEWFKERPTIAIAYLDIEYSKAEIKFLYYNKDSKEVEISHTDNHELLVKPKDVLAQLEKEVAKHKADIEDLENKKKYFIANFKQYFAEFASSDILKEI